MSLTEACNQIKTKCLTLAQYLLSSYKCILPITCSFISDPDTGEINRRRTHDSDSESDLSLDHASLDLASSHSSDEDEYNGDTWKKKTATKPPGNLIYQFPFGTL